MAAIVKAFAILKLVNVTPMGLAVRYVTLLRNCNYVIEKDYVINTQFRSIDFHFLVGVNVINAGIQMAEHLSM